jgi:hypothetical protein
MARVGGLSIQDNFPVLGVVTLQAVQSPLDSIALISSSNFERWSTTVKESKSLELPIILSDHPLRYPHPHRASPADRALLLCELGRRPGGRNGDYYA